MYRAPSVYDCFYSFTNLLVSTVLNLNQTANSPKSALLGGAMFLRANYRWNVS